MEKQDKVLVKMAEEFRAEVMAEFSEVYYGGSDEDETYASLAKDPMTGNWYFFNDDNRWIGTLEEMVRMANAAGYSITFKAAK